jgi:hypothetical protein
MNEAVRDSLSYFSDRLHHLRRRPRLRLSLRRPRRVTRRICMKLEPGKSEVIPRVNDSVVVHCAEGTVWITHDGDPKDIVLEPNQSYQADHEQVMRMLALEPAVVEVQFEDEVMEPVIPARAGIQGVEALDPRLRGYDD